MKSRFPPGVLVAIAVGGAAGSLLRAAVSQWLPTPAHGFPSATLLVNVAGCAVIGFVIVAALERSAPSRYFRPLIGTGFCGGLTTFSTFVVETDLLIRAGRLAVAAAYVLASLLAGLGAARAAMVLTRAAWAPNGEAE